MLPGNEFRLKAWGGLGTRLRYAPSSCHEVQVEVEVKVKIQLSGIVEVELLGKPLT